MSRLFSLLTASCCISTLVYCPEVEETHDVVNRNEAFSKTPHRGSCTVFQSLDKATNWSSFHQVLNRARWSPLAVSRQLLLLIVETFVLAGACVELVIDETLERRWGSKIEPPRALP